MIPDAFFLDGPGGLNTDMSTWAPLVTVLIGSQASAALESGANSARVIPLLSKMTQAASGQDEMSVQVAAI